MKKAKVVTESESQNRTVYFVNIVEILLAVPPLRCLKAEVGKLRSGGQMWPN